MRGIIAAVAITVSTPVAAADFNWQKQADRLLVDGALNNAARFCVEGFGFTRVPRKPANMMADKIHAHLLLSSNPTGELEEWVRYVEGMTKLDEDTASLEERMADALIAAAADPESYSRAEKLFVDTLMDRMNRSLASCQAGARSKFTGQHYWTGDGSSERYIAMAKKNFAKGVEEFRKEETQPRK